MGHSKLRQLERCWNVEPMVRQVFGIERELLLIDDTRHKEKERQNEKSVAETGRPKVTGGEKI